MTFTVDPEFDTPAVLAEYGKAHGAGREWKFLTGPRGDLWNLSSNGFGFEVAEDAKNTKMPILHSSDFALVDRQGRLRGTYDGLSTEGVAKLKRDLAKVLAEPAPGGSGGGFKFPIRRRLSPPRVKSRGSCRLRERGGLGRFTISVQRRRGGERDY